MMIAASRLVVIVGAVSACTIGGSTEERGFEREILSGWGIAGNVRCPSDDPGPGSPRSDSLTCELDASDDQKYRVLVKYQYRTAGAWTAREHRLIVFSTDGKGVLFPKSLLESTAGERVECPNGKRHLHVTLDKPGFCKIKGSDDHVRIALKDIEAETWFWKRVPSSAVTR